MEVLVADDALDALEVEVRRGLGRCEDKARVEDVERLILHRTHVEVVDGNNVKEVQVVLAAELLLVPLHGALQRRHCVVDLIDVALLHVDPQRNAAAAHRCKRVLFNGELARDKGKKITRLRKRVHPLGVVLAGLAFNITAGLEVAVGEQHRVQCLVRLDVRRVFRHDVGAVEEVRDAAEPFRLTLCAEVATALVQAFEQRVLLGLDLHDGVDLKTSRRIRWKCIAVQRERRRAQRVLIRRELDAVDGDAFQRHVVTTVELKSVFTDLADGRVAHLELHVRGNGRELFTQVEGHVDCVHDNREGGIILAEDLRHFS
eukprot:PhM_4_TR17409/c0_g1_i2/m.69949